MTIGQSKEDVFREFPEDIRPAATLDFAGIPAAADEWFAAYVSNENTMSPPMVIPIVRGETSMFVPADMTVVPLRVRAGHITAAGDPLRLRRQERKRISFPSEGETLVAWVTFKSAGRRAGTIGTNCPRHKCVFDENGNRRCGSFSSR